MNTMSHWQRIEAALHDEPVDHVPVALWRHFPNDDICSDKLVRHTLDWQAKWDFDLVKFMPSGTYSIEDWGAATAYQGAANGARVVVEPAVRRSEDWLQIRHQDVRRGSWGRQNDALGVVARALRGRVPILQTVFSPLTTARKMATDGLYADMRRAPEALEQALRVITDMTIEFSLQAIRSGAHGIFLATQQASSRLMTHDEFTRFGQRYDLEVLEALRGKARLNMLHAHGDDILFDQLARYPVEMMNWHDRLTEPALAGAAGHFPGMLVGGLDEHGTLMHGSHEDIADQVRDAIEQTQGRRLMIGPGCVVPVAVRDEALLAVVQAARTPVHEALSEAALA